MGITFKGVPQSRLKDEARSASASVAGVYQYILLSKAGILTGR